MKLYTDEHTWLEIKGKEATLGISSFGIGELGQIVFVDLPQVATRVSKETAIVVIESTKAAIEVYSPLEGTVIAVNTSLHEDLSALNNDPESQGWLIRIAVEHPEEWKDGMDQESYKRFLA